MSVPAAALSSLRETFAGEVVLPGDSEYDAARAVWNGGRPPARDRPRPANSPDVTNAIGFAREQELAIAVKEAAGTASRALDLRRRGR